jgi:hypothetical protein
MDLPWPRASPELSAIRVSINIGVGSATAIVAGYLMRIVEAEHELLRSAKVTQAQLEAMLLEG